MDRAREFETQFSRCEMDLRAFIGAVVRERVAREDIFQAVAAALWENFDRYDTARSFCGWARGMAVNRILQHQREAAVAAPLSPDAIEALREAFDRTERPGVDRQAPLDACVRRLPERSADLLSLRYCRGISPAEIATQLHHSVETVHNSLSRLRTQLAECVRRRVDSTPPATG